MEDSSEEQLDSGDMFIVIASAKQPHSSITREEKEELMSVAHHILREKYDAGVPFFGKDIFRDISLQFEKCQHGTTLSQKVAITDLNGSTIEFPIETGQVYPTDINGPHYQYIITKPRLTYKTIEFLTEPGNVALFSPYYSYLPIEVIHSTEKRCLRNGEPRPSWPMASIDNTRTRFEVEQREWVRGELFQQLKSILITAGLRSGITKIVAFACSTMTFITSEKLPSIAQHALVLMLRDLLTQQENGAGQIKCYAQDPIYTSIDEQILNEVGITVLDDPQGFIEVDEMSIVVSISPDIPVKQIIADITRPAVLIWDNGSKERFSYSSADPDSPRVTKMLLQEYNKLKFPNESAESECFGNLTVYIRKNKK